MRAIVLAFALLSFGCFGNAPPSLTPAKTWTREEFKTLVVGKTKEDVLKTLGKPEHTDEYSTFDIWTYRRVTRDTITDKIDFGARVRFAKPSGTATEVEF